MDSSPLFMSETGNNPTYIPRRRRSSTLLASESGEYMQTQGVDPANVDENSSQPLPSDAEGPRGSEELLKELEILCKRKFPA